jgi:dTDP-4-dehydrorhamnose 3,5-epimerase
MKITRTEIPDVLLVELRVFPDQRGHFFESFNQRVWEEQTGLKTIFVQDNQSRSSRGVLRGLHYQVSPSAQGKLVRVLTGEIFDVAVDLRQKSATFGRWLGVRLSAEEPRQLWIPEGFAHGFLVLSASADVLYKTTDYYNPTAERSIVWNDPQLGIDWPATVAPGLSEKDAAAGPFATAPYFD